MLKIEKLLHIVCDQAVTFVFSVECASQVQSAFVCAF